MKILVVGGGGREHAICQVLDKSQKTVELMVSPGNGGMKETLPEMKICGVKATDKEGLLALALKEKVDLTIIGPEDSLSTGVVDLFKGEGLLIVGPSKAASFLEASKSFAKEVMRENNVPTASYAEFKEAASALSYIESHPGEQMVVKCDGLAQGKGVIVCHTKSEARAAVTSLMEEKLLGENRDHIIIEEFLEGQEVSAFALCDGVDFTFLGAAADHKRLREGDQGPNTGGMGVYSPVALLRPEDEEWIAKNIFAPMMAGMKKRGTPFAGILFAGLMKTRAGWKVIEFNVRFGDPETQVLLPLIDEDLTPWFLASARGELKRLQESLGRTSPLKKNKKGVHVVMAAHGYPGTEGIAIKKGDAITFDAKFALKDDDYVFFAGVENKEGTLKTSGGRVLGVTSLKKTFQEAREQVYESVARIHFEGAQFRRDIARGQN